MQEKHVHMLLLHHILFQHVWFFKNTWLINSFKAVKSNIILNKPNYEFQLNQQVFSLAGSFRITFHLTRNLVSDLLKTEASFFTRKDTKQNFISLFMFSVKVKLT